MINLDENEELTQMIEKVKLISRRDFLVALGIGGAAAGVVMIARYIPFLTKYLSEPFLDRTVKKETKKVLNHNLNLIVGDFHFHTPNSDGRESVYRHFELAKKRGLNAAVPTDHLGVEEIRFPEWVDSSGYKRGFMNTVRQQRKYLELCYKRGIVPIKTTPGVEISSAQGHVVAVFPETYFNESELIKLYGVKPGLSFSDTLSNISDFGGCAIAAHPGVATENYYGVELRVMDEAREKHNFDTEVLSTMNPDIDLGKKPFPDNHLGVSDAHRNEIGTCFSVFPDTGGKLFDIICSEKSQPYAPIFKVLNKHVLSELISYYRLIRPAR